MNDYADLVKQLNPALYQFGMLPNDVPGELLFAARDAIKELER